MIMTDLPLIEIIVKDIFDIWNWIKKKCPSESEIDYVN